jgi:hypothetical protein
MIMLNLIFSLFELLSILLEIVWPRDQEIYIKIY